MSLRQLNSLYSSVLIYEIALKKIKKSMCTLKYSEILHNPAKFLNEEEI